MLTKLLKYEFRKTLASKIILLVLTAVLEAFYLYTVFSNKVDHQTLAIVLLVLLGSFGVIFMGIQSILTLHRDMNTRQGYMLFMTPNSSYKILGAKVIETSLSTLFAGGLYVVLGIVDIRLLLAKNHDLGSMLNFFRSVADMMGQTITFNLFNIITLIVLALMSWLSTVLIAYLADALASSLLNGKKGGLLVCFVLFLILNYLSFKLGDVVPSVASPVADFVIQLVYLTVINVVMYFFSARLMERHLSV